MTRYLLLLIAGLSGCGQTPHCASEVRQVARDPGSDRYAVTESRNCHGSTSTATIVRVGRGSQVGADAQEVFVADTDDGNAASGERGTIWTNVVWTSPGRLMIAHASRARISKRLTASNGAEINYRATDPIAAPEVP
ncbi:MAG: hypothetical protein ACTHJR_16625 [Sphingomonas sp.]|uniref:hypothetical protein n=1 Tax=Sphingomonas sp. TaxID=28214 RepID=UPI003F7E6582